MKIERIPFAEIDKKWQDRWEAEGAFRAPKTPRVGRKFYCLDMFPYPSAAGLHVGHPEGYTAPDILSRYKRMLDFAIGDRVTFQPEGRGIVVGMLTRYNKRTVTVITDSGERWNVAPHVLRRVVESGTAQEGNPNVVPMRKK